MHCSSKQNKDHVHKCFPWFEGAMDNAFNIDIKKGDCHRLDHNFKVSIPWVLNIKIVTQNSSMAKLALLNHIWSTTKDGPSMLPSCLLLKIWYLQQQCSKHKISYSCFQVHVQSHLVVVAAISPWTITSHKGTRSTKNVWCKKRIFETKLAKDA